MSRSFSTFAGFFCISWKFNGQESSVTVHNFDKAMNLYLKLKVKRPKLWYFPQDGKEPKVIRRGK